MNKTKFGLKQLDRPAPLAYRRFSSAYIVVLMPALAALIEGWGFTDPLLVKRLLVLVIFSGSFIKAIGLFLGNTQFYAPSNDFMDKMDKKEKDDKQREEDKNNP